MTTKELIREKIDSFYAEYKAKFHQNGEPYNLGIIDGLDMAERILDTLPDEPVTDCHELKEAAIDFADNARKALYSKDYAISSIADYDHGCIDGFIAGAEWQKAKMMGEATYNELMEQYIAIRDELVKRHRDVPVNIKEEL